MRDLRQDVTDWFAKHRPKEDPVSEDVFPEELTEEPFEPTEDVLPVVANMELKSDDEFAADEDAAAKAKADHKRRRSEQNERMTEARAKE